MAYGKVRVDQIQSSTRTVDVDDLATTDVATQSVAGLLSATDKTKLDGVAAGAEVNVNADWNAGSGDAQILNKPTIGTSAGNLVQLDGSARLPAVDGSLLTGLVAATNLSYTASTRLLESSTGTDVTLPLVASSTAGLVPASGGGTTNFLRADGTFAAPPGGSPGGSTTQVQFNNAGAFGGDADLTWDSTTNVLGVTGDVNLSDGGTFTTTLQTITPTADRTISLPNATGTVALVAGSSGQVIYNNAGVNAGSANFTFDGFRVLASALGYYSRRPPLHRGPLFTKTAGTTISVVAGAVLNGTVYAAATAVTMGTHVDNTDMAIWQHPTTGALVSDASYTTAPAGATGGSIVGGYHYIPSGRPTAFNNGSPTGAAEILEFSIWDLTWRPTCPDPRGMACIDGRFWCDLYLCGSTSYASTTFSAVPSSKIGLTIADNNSPALIPSFYGGNGSTAYTLTGGNLPGSWYNFAEVAHSFGKRFMYSWEFQAAAFGAPEAGSRGSDPGTVVWERQSKWGLAQATGTLYVWAIERVGIFTGSNTNSTGGRGTEFALAPRALILGGSWNIGAASGSRLAYWGNVPSSADINIGARFAAEHLVLG